MNKKSFTDVAAENWKLILAVMVAAIVVVGGVGLWRDHQQTKELEATNALYDAQKSAQGLIAAKQYDQAEKAYDKLFAQYGGSRAAYEAELQIGDMYTDAKNLEKATEHYEKAAKLAGDSFSKVLARYNLGIAQEMAGKYKEAVATYEDTLKSEGSDFLKPEVLMAQARCYQALNETAKAIEVYKTVEEKFASRPYYSPAASALEKQLSAKKL